MKKLIVRPNAGAQARYKARANIIKAMAHPSRLLIIDALAVKELCVCELTELIGADTSTVSKHLSVLKNAGIVTDEKRGTMVYYRLRVSCIMNFFGCIESVMESSARDHLALVRK